MNKQQITKIFFSIPEHIPIHLTFDIYRGSLTVDYGKYNRIVGNLPRTPGGLIKTIYFQREREFTRYTDNFKRVNYTFKFSRGRLKYFLTGIYSDAKRNKNTFITLAENKTYKYLKIITYIKCDNKYYELASTLCSEE